MRMLVSVATAVLLLVLAGGAKADTMIGPFHMLYGEDCRFWQEWVNEDKSTEVISIGYFDGGRGVTLLFGDSRWQLKQDEEMRIILGVDKAWKNVFLATAPKTDKAVAYLHPVNSEAIEALRTGNELFMDIEGKGEDYSYAYALDDDVTKAIDALETCRDQTAKLDSGTTQNATTNQPNTGPAVVRSDFSPNADGTSERTVFGTQTPTIYYSALLSGVSPNTAAHVDWIAEKSQVVAPNFKVGSVEVQILGPVDNKPNTGLVTSSFSKPTAGWPVGVYRVDLFIGEKQLKSLRFRIE